MRCRCGIMMGLLSSNPMFAWDTHPPTLIGPFSSMRGFSVKRGLFFEIFLLSSKHWNSSVKASCCTAWMMVFLAWLNSLTLYGLEQWCHHLLHLWLVLFYKSVWCALDMPMAQRSIFQLEKCLKRSEPSWPCLVVVINAATSGQTSTSAVGSTRSNGPEVRYIWFGQDNNGGPVSYVVSFRQAAGTDLVAWSAGFWSLDT